MISQRVLAQFQIFSLLLEKLTANKNQALGKRKTNSVPLITYLKITRPRFKMMKIKSLPESWLFSMIPVRLIGRNSISMSVSFLTPDKGLYSK